MNRRKQANAVPFNNFFIYYKVIFLWVAFCTIQVRWRRLYALKRGYGRAGSRLLRVAAISKGTSSFADYPAFRRLNRVPV